MATLTFQVRLWRLVGNVVRATRLFVDPSASDSLFQNRVWDIKFDDRVYALAFKVIYSPQNTQHQKIGIVLSRIIRKENDSENNCVKSVASAGSMGQCMGQRLRSQL